MEDSILSFRVGKRKPAAEMFTAVLARAGVSPRQAWYVDDIQDFVGAAEKLGMWGIRYRTAPELADALGIA
jgi:HAD superfamily hydrolase (TIGR01509 family)